jgi:hypothetical protein
MVNLISIPASLAKHQGQVTRQRVRLLDQPAGSNQINRAVQSFGDGVETGART